MPDSKRVTQQFIDDFELVAKFYGLRESGEYELAKQVVRNDLAHAQTCFASIAEQLRQS